jgi:23S rRNA (cytidine1920-2'-O)/16S rRNA (cytidine1409-2'-O)-methyltransferase
MSRKERIDLLLVERGLAESRSQAQRLVMAGQVRAAGEMVHKPSSRVDRGAAITVEARSRFVSRGGDKLLAALEQFPVNVEGRVCADVGASTGGFTDCLLQHGARRVYAIDVGHGVLHYRLRDHPRLVLMERTNARKLESLPEPIQLTTIDASFISLSLLMPSVRRWLGPEADVIALVKPQFEAGPKNVGKGGVVRDPQVHRQVLKTVIASAIENHLAPQGLMRSPLKGPKGNAEFLLWCRFHADAQPSHLLLRMVFENTDEV